MLRCDGARPSRTGSGFAEDTGVETYGTVMSSFEGRSGWLPTLCDYGYYHAPDGTCISVEFQSPECPEIVISDVSYGTHRVDLDTNSFLVFSNPLSYTSTFLGKLL